jgi:glycosyltransferase involved in cell wall biosynthesis
MRVLTISNCPLNPTEGSGQIICNYTEGLRKAGHTVDFMGPDDYEVLQLLRPRANSYRQAVGMWRSASRKLRANDHDVVEFYGGEAWLAISRLAQRRNRRFLLVQHTNGPEPRYEKMLDDYFGPRRRTWYQIRREPSMKRAFTKPDLVVTVSEYDRDWLIEQNYQPPDRIVAIENPIAGEFFEKPLSANKEKLIGYCGTWLPKKGIHVLAEDIGRILKEFPDYRLLLVGVGPVFEKERYFSTEVCPRIEVVSYVESKMELRNLYARMSIFVLPSVIESFGLALAEAMACGCVAVATKVGFAAGLTHREDAMLLESAESPKLYRAVRELIANADLRMRLSRQAPRAVQHLRWNHAVEKLCATYVDQVRHFRSALC